MSSISSLTPVSVVCILGRFRRRNQNRNQISVDLYTKVKFSAHIATYINYPVSFTTLGYKPYTNTRLLTLFMKIIVFLSLIDSRTKTHVFPETETRVRKRGLHALMRRRLPIFF